MTTADQIRNRLAALSPISISVRDDSALHTGHAGARGGGGHYHLDIVSDQFEGLSTLKRHRLIYQHLGELMTTHIHALSISARARAD